MRLKLYPLLSLIVIGALALPAFTSFAQSTPKERPKLKDFGSSLFRLKRETRKKETASRKGEKKSETELDEGDVIRIESNLVTSEVLVVDNKGNFIQNITPDDLVVTEDGEPQKVAHFLRGDDLTIPRTIVLLIDYSGSQLPFIRRSIDAAKLLVDKLGPLDVMAIVTDDVEVLVDYTSDKDQLKKKLESLFERTQGNKLGRSAQFSALVATLGEAFNEEDRRPIIIFQTDGDELFHLRDPIVGLEIMPDLSEDVRKEVLRGRQGLSAKPYGVDFSLFDVYRMVERSPAIIYSVIPGFRLLNKSPEEQVETMRKANEFDLARSGRWSPKEQEKFKAMKDKWRIFSPANLAFAARQAHIIQQALFGVASRTGGWAEFLETPEEADGIYNRILIDINHRYIIGYYPTNKEHDGTRRTIKVKVKDHPEYVVLARKAYYAPGP